MVASHEWGSGSGGHLRMLSFHHSLGNYDFLNARDTVVTVHSVVSGLFVTPQTVVRHAPLSMGFPWPEYWSGLPFPTPRDLPDPGIKPTSPVLAGRFFTTSAPPEKPPSTV